MGFSSGTYTRTNGTETGANTWEDARDSGDNILAADHDTHDQDIADALSSCIVKDGQTTVTANLPMGGYRHTNVGAAAAVTDYARTDQVQNGALIWGGTDSGAADAYVITLTIAPVSYQTGAHFRFIPANDNTGASTLNVNALGVKNIKKGDGTEDPAAADIVAGGICEVVYDGTSFILLNPLGTVTTSDIANDAVTAAKIGDLSDNVVFDTAGKGVKLDVTTGISAAGTTQGTATALTSLVNEVDTVTGAAAGVVLPAVTSFIGMTIWVVNTDSSDTLTVYPASGEGFGGESVDAGISLTAGSSGAFTGIKTGSGDNWGKIT